MEEDGGRSGGGSSSGCLEPRALLLLATVAVTVAATGLLTGAIMSDHWEHIAWDRAAVKRLATAGNLTGTQVIVEWFLDGRVTHISAREYHRGIDFLTKEGPELASLYLVPMYGGIWTLCLALNGMQNLSISCALVCLIILGSSALVGAFGILKHQISAVLVTGVMYLLAGTFALFTLAIIHFKRRSGGEREECRGRDSSEGVILGEGGREWPELWRPYLGARLYSPGWGLELGWAALGLCAAASSLWLLLAKAMRYTPLSTLLA